MSSIIVRNASHAGSWYSDNSAELSAQLDGWLSQAQQTHFPARAIIAPHAGYSYCGACSAFAYRQIDPISTRYIFILGSSHSAHINGCALSSASLYSTPLYDLPIDQDIYAELRATNLFQTMSLDVDEHEHSIEMHLPYVAKLMESHRDSFSIVPILVGSLSSDLETQYARLLSKFLSQPSCVFVISSDFCHWGSRFGYTPGSSGRELAIHEFIDKLDHEAMDIIESKNVSSFKKYLSNTGNTICGRKPISLLLSTIAQLSDGQLPGKMKFLKYAQSSKCKRSTDSSVSYASASFVL